MEFTLDSATRIHFLVGDPIAQVIGPTMLSEMMAASGVNGLMLPLHVSRHALPGVLKAFDDIQNLDSVLITVPHKIATVAHCSSLSPRASKLGVVNVIRRDGKGGWYGDNFDGPGFVKGLENKGHIVAGKRAYMAGAGGAGASIAVSLLDAGLDHITIFDPKEEALAGLLSLLEKHYAGRAGAQPGPLSGFDIVINATSLGLRSGDALPVDLSGVKPGTLVADVITKPAVTPFMEHALSLGCLVHSGTEMLEGQIQLLFEFIQGR